MRPVLLLLVLATAAEREFVVNERFGLRYADEPVSAEFDFAPPVKAGDLSLGAGVPCQVEVLAGSAEACTRARIWTRVSFDGVGQQRFPVLTDGAARGLPPVLQPQPAESLGGVATCLVDTGAARVRIPAGGAAFPGGVPAFEVPGPVVQIGPAGATSPLWGAGWIDHLARVERIDCTLVAGPVFVQSSITYVFAGGGTYKVVVRLVPGRPYASLIEDCAAGGAARFVFAFDGFAPARFLRRKDGGWAEPQPIAGARNPAGDFITEEGSDCLARLVIWSQFGYFGGKQETIGLVDAEGAWCIGGSYVRPDRWTRAKVNHVDLWVRPQQATDRASRGVAGLDGAAATPAMEAWIINGHREWNLFCVAPQDAAAVEKARAKVLAVRDSEKKKLEAANADAAALAALETEFAQRHAAVWCPTRWLQKTHVTDGAWPLDRLNRLTLVWSADGAPVPAEQQALDKPAGGIANAVLHGTGFRQGLDLFNGSNVEMRSGFGRAVKGQCEAAAQGGLRVDPADPGSRRMMVETAAAAFFMMDESAYPSRRAMLPWTDPEALNPFYQGMENMNFNADRYRLVGEYGHLLHLLKHPQAATVLGHAEEQMDLALGRYVYPGSGCWEESHGYCGHTIKNLLPLAPLLRAEGGRDFFADERFQSLLGFWVDAHSPRDPGFGAIRVPPPIGDHGGPGNLTPNLGWWLVEATAAPAAFNARLAWLMSEAGGTVPGGLEPAAIEPASRDLFGYGAVLRQRSVPVTYRVVTLDGATTRDKKPAALALVLRPTTAGGFEPVVLADRRQRGRLAAEADGTLAVTMQLAGEKAFAGGEGVYRLKHAGDTGTWTGTVAGSERTGAWAARTLAGPSEQMVTLRAGASWGHHHQDKGSLWVWARDQHLIGDACWGGPPGGTYGNEYKQGPAGHSQIEYRGINNWPLPCKYATAYIADRVFTGAVDYAAAVCPMPYNPALDLAAGTPPAAANRWTRQVVSLPDLVVVRDVVESTCPTVWRVHSLQPQGTTVDGAGATIATGAGVVAALRIVHPATGVALQKVDRDLLNDYKDAAGKPLPPEQAPAFGSSAELKWEMPRGCRSATWVLAVGGEGDAAPEVTSLDPEGRVLRVVQGGRRVIVCCDARPFAWEGEGLRFRGTAGAVVSDGGRTSAVPLRADDLTVK